MGGDYEIKVNLRYAFVDILPLCEFNSVLFKEIIVLCFVV